MATSTFIKFSLLTIAVILSSYVTYTEGVSAAPLPPNPTSTDMINCYNSTIQIFITALGSCGGPNCSKGQPFIIQLQTVFYLLFVALVGSCTSCSLSLINLVTSILSTLATMCTELLIIIQLATVTTVIINISLANIFAQILGCISQLTAYGGSNSLAVISGLLNLHIILTNIFSQCVNSP